MQIKYGVTADANVALVAATPKTVLAVQAHAAFPVEVVAFDIGMLGVSASDVPVQIELCTWTGAGAGTGAGAATITQQSGFTIAPGFTADADYSAEPTVLAVVRRMTLTPNGGSIVYDLPFGAEVQSRGLSPFGIAMRLTAPANVNCVPGFTVARF